MKKNICKSAIAAAMIFSVHILPLSAAPDSPLLSGQMEQPSEVLRAKIKAISPTAQFDNKHTIRKGIKDIAVEFTMPVQAGNSALASEEEGFLFGKFTANGKWFLGTTTSMSIAPGSYLFWAIRQGSSWKVFAANENGDIVAATSEVNVMENKEAHGKITILADEGPGTVHGCYCYTVMECGTSLSGYTLCIPTRVCSCWN